MAEKFYIETLGCQMNKLDSELIAASLVRKGLEETNSAEKADIAIINTCSVRRHAELKALSRFGRLYYLKKRYGKPYVIAAVGCFAQKAADYIKEKCPFIDIICSPGRIYKLAELLEIVRCKEKTSPSSPIIELDNIKALRCSKEGLPEELEEFDLKRPVIETPSKQAFVRVQRGCDKFCSYCVVPYVRGPEQSRPIEHILEEVKRFDDAGFKEITLLGQTVNSYRWKQNGKVYNLADLLYKIHKTTSIPRIRFITSYPADFSDDIFYAMGELERVCNYLHIPAQHGSNRILKLMNRKYTVEEYLELIEKAKKIVKDISFAGDFIVGFPTETDKDHEKTLELVEKVRYKNCFIFKYSARSGTLAYRRYKEKIPDKVVTERFRQLQSLQEKIATEDNKRLIGRQLDILVEGKAKKSKDSPQQLVGRTREDKIVVFKGPDTLIGNIVRVKIEDATAITLFGRLIESPSSS